MTDTTSETESTLTSKKRVKLDHNRVDPVFRKLKPKRDSTLVEQNKETSYGSKCQNPKRYPLVSFLSEPYVEIINKRKATEYDIARSRLLSQVVNPHRFPCREKEMEDIHQSLVSALELGTGCCLYISGVPGTGKTATVQSVIKRLQSNPSTINNFKTVEINGLKLSEPKQAYTVLWQALQNLEDSKSKISASKSLEHLEHYFHDTTLSSSTSSKQIMHVVVMDELDVLINRSQSVIYNFFEWANRPLNGFVLIAIANLMDLPERYLSNRVTSRLGLKRINFQPYSHLQLVKILESRLPEKVLDKDAIELCARKVSAVSGDARKALDICRRAIEIAETKSAKEVKNNEKGLLVSMETLHQAIKEIYISAGNLTLQQSSFHQRLFVASLMKCMRKENMLEIPLHQIVEFHDQLCRVYEFDQPTVIDFFRMVHHLNQTKIIVLCESNLVHLDQKIRLRPTVDDAQRSLSSSHELFKKILLI